MKHLRLLPVVLLTLFPMFGLAGCATTAAENTAQIVTSNQQEGIWVTGEGEVTIKPDIANISLGVSSQEASVADAMAKTKDAMSKVVAAIKANNVQGKDIQTQQYNISPVYTYDPQTGNQTVSGYQVTNIVNVKLRDTSRASTVIGAVAEAGGDLTRIDGVIFTVEDPTTYYKEARQKAIEDADHKAQKLAGLYGVTLGKPDFVSEYSATPPIYSLPSVGSAFPVPAAAPFMPPVSAGSTAITLYIQASYPILK